MVADVVGRPLRAIPDPGRLVLVDEMGLHTGGCAINASSALVSLGVETQVIGKVGTDAFGDFLINALNQRGIGSGGVLRDVSVGTSATMIMVEADGERRYVHYIGANAALTRDEVDMGLIKDAAVLHIAGALVMPGLDGTPTAAILEEARRSGVITFLDTVWDDTGRWSRLLPCLPHLDYFVPTIEEAQALSGLNEPEAVADWLIDRGVGTAGLKMAGDGCFVKNRAGETARLPAFQVDVVDTTGAGDSWAAGFITGVLQGDWELEKIARFANATAGLCVTGVGASGGTRSFAETLAFMESAPLRSL
jgi:sugar/nucleoside kinase (ribokinase family)